MNTEGWTTVTDWRARLTVKHLVVGASVAVFAGLLALVIPVSVSNGGSKVGCGNGFIRDNNPAENYSMRYSAQGWADILGYESRGPKTSWKPYSDCTDALTTRRWIGWLLIIGGLGAGAFAVRQLVDRRSTMPIRSSSTTESDPTYFRVDQGAGVLTAEDTPAAQPFGTAPSADTSALPAAWYPDQADPTRVRWFDGTRWTEATLPAEQNPDTPMNS